MDENARQKNSPAYRLAALDTDFLLGASMRGVRLQIEYEKAEERLRAWGVRSTIVFGSARALPRGSGDEAASKATLSPGGCRAPATNRRTGMKRRGALHGSLPSEVARSDRSIASAIM